MSVSSIVLIALAVLPGLFLANYVYKRDKVNVEPAGLLWSLVALGALSAIPAGLIEALLDPVVGSLCGYGTVAYLVVDAFFVVAVAEEGCKFVMLRLRTWKNINFDFSFDGIVYGVMVGIGFATIENILYVLQNGFGTGIARALLSVPGHVSWGVIMGYFYGRAKAYYVMGDEAKRRSNMVLALVVPILGHGFYDMCAFLSGPLLFVLIAFALAMDVVMVLLIKRESARDEAFWQPISTVGFAQYAASPQAYATPQAYQPQSYQEQPVPPYQGPTGYQQPYQPQAYQPQQPYQQPQQPYQVPTYYQQQAQGEQKPFKFGAFLAKRILAYIGVALALFVMAVAVDLAVGEGPFYDFLVYAIALLVIGFVPYVVIMLFAAGMRSRRAAQQAW